MKKCFLSREQSWLQFNMRVAGEADDVNVPLLERLKFLSIYKSNLDEFFMVRIGAWIHRCTLTPDYVDPKTGWDPETELKKALQTVRAQQETIEAIYERLSRDLKEAGIDVIDFNSISKVDESMAKKLFTEIKPFLTARVVDGEHPMPFVDNRETCVAAILGKGSSSKLGIVSFMRLPKYRTFEINGRQKVIMMADLIAYHSRQLFKGYEVREVCPIRVTRNADVLLDALNGTEDFRASMEKMLRKRKREQPVRLELTGRPSIKLETMVRTALKIPEKQVFVSRLPVTLTFGSGIKPVEGMKYGEQRSVRTVGLKKGQYFKYLEKKDLLLSFPYQSMMPFVELLYEAGDNPDVTSIQITLYRLSATSQVAAALAYAANQGKQVICLLELRARFDEQNNIDYSEMLEEAGCSVIYGLPDMKVHSKLCLITYRNGDSVKYITQVGTGNYNEVTSEQYCDLSMMTSDPDVGRDAAAAFEALVLGRAPERTETLMIAPEGFKSRVLELLEAERNKGSEGRVSIKVNSINDMDIMKSMIECSKAGVKIELFVRGICCIRPGIEGLTENITVKSVVGRYLEHSRVLVFGTGAEQRIFIGSGDFLSRNTMHRVEAFIEVKTEETRKQVLEVMDAFRDDKEKCSTCLPDGSYVKEEYILGTSSLERLYNYFKGIRVDEVPEEKKKKGFFAWLKRLFTDY